MVQGTLQALRNDNAIIVDQVGSETKLASHSTTGTIPLQVGDTMELNDHYARVVGICQVSRTFQSQPVIYTTYDRATYFAPAQRKSLSFIIAHSKPDVDVKKVCQQISKQTGLLAYTAADMKFLTLKYYVHYTGIFVNFGVAIILGFIIGTAIAGQTLYNFTVDNIRFFAIFKAMGADNGLLMRMVLLQALFVSIIGWGIGIGFASLFGLLSKGTELSFSMPLFLYLGSAASILLISLSSACICMRTVRSIDPAIVFK